jgi:hypothetical protein
MIKECINLFKSVPITKEDKALVSIPKLMSQGMVVEQSVLSEYSLNTILDFYKDLVPDSEKIYSTFHKTWNKVIDSSMQQLVAEQVLHYFSTYGLESLGLASHSYIPAEELNIPEVDYAVPFVLVKGITEEEIKERIAKLISTDIALSEKDIQNLMLLIKKLELDLSEVDIKNRELSTQLAIHFSYIPKNPIDFLRIQVARATGRSLLIKDKETFELIKSRNLIDRKHDIFEPYVLKYGIEPLASIFYRFKPLFLAFKSVYTKSAINKIRKLAPKHHKPLVPNVLDTVTKFLRSDIKWGTPEYTDFSKKLVTALEKVNIFRKIKVLQAIAFYSHEYTNSVVYKIRNEKSYSTATTPIKQDERTKFISNFIMESIQSDLAHLKDKKIYLPDNLAFPTSGKQFLGEVPFGTKFMTKKSLVIGVHWFNTDAIVDLDLSCSSLTEKMGWDGRYRNGSFAFSGDITDAPKPYGSTESFLVREDAKDGIYIFRLNFFSGGSDSVPYTLFVSEEDEPEMVANHYMTKKDNIKFYTQAEIDRNNRQRNIGVLKVERGVKTFVIYEMASGKGITARNSSILEHTINYYSTFLDQMLDLKRILEYVNVPIVETAEKADIDLSIPNLTKDTLLNLLTGK